MVFPRLKALTNLDRGLLKQSRRQGGMIQRGRVVSVDATFSPPVLVVALHLRGGLTATIPNVLSTSSVYSPAAIQGPDLTVAQVQQMARPEVGQEVLLLCPSGRAADECYAVGLATTATALTDSASSSVDGFRTVNEAGLKVRWTIAADQAVRRLTVTGLAARLGAGARVSPSVSIDGETFRSPFTFPLVGVSGERSVTFAGSWSRLIEANTVGVVEAVFAGDGSIPLVGWEYELAVSDTTPPVGALEPETVGNAYPAVAVYGRLG